MQTGCSPVELLPHWSGYPARLARGSPGTVPANRTLSSGFGIRLAAMACTVWRRVRGSNSSHSLDRGAATPVASRSRGAPGASRTRALPLRTRRARSAGEGLGDVRVMLPSETDSQSAGFNLLPHATVRGVRIELTHTGIQNRRPTLDHPPVVSSLECGSNAPLRVFSAALSPGQLSRARACRADLGSRTQLAGVRTRSDHHDHLIGRAVGVGIEPTESALTVRSVYQHTSPTRWVANPEKMGSATAVHGRPPYA